MNANCMRGISLGVLALLAACGGDGDDDGGACGAESPLSGTSIDDLGKLARIALQDRRLDGTTTAPSANASFMDFSLVEPHPAPTLNFDLVCSTVVGDGSSTPPVSLTSPTATIGIGGSDVALTEVAPGRMQASNLPALQAEGAVTVHVEGGEGDEEFPSFDLEMNAQDAPLAPAIERSSNGELVLRWTPSGADAIGVELWVLEPDDDYHPVRCVVADDGCLTVSSDAAAYAFDDSAEPVPLDIRISSVRSTQWDGPEGEVGFLEIERRNDIAYEP